MTELKLGPNSFGCIGSSFSSWSRSLPGGRLRRQPHRDALVLLVLAALWALAQFESTVVSPRS